MVLTQRLIDIGSIVVILVTIQLTDPNPTLCTVAGVFSVIWAIGCIFTFINALRLLRQNRQEAQILFCMSAVYSFQFVGFSLLADLLLRKKRLTEESVKKDIGFVACVIMIVIKVFYGIQEQFDMNDLSRSFNVSLMY